MAELGANVHLAHPLGVKAFSYRQVEKMSATRGLADLLRRGRLLEALLLQGGLVSYPWLVSSAAPRTGVSQE